LKVAGYVGQSKFVEIFPIVCEMLGIEIKDYRRLFYSIRIRVKGDRITFLDILKKALLKRMDELDNK
jgi:hypothetical protein